MTGILAWFETLELRMLMRLHCFVLIVLILKALTSMAQSTSNSTLPLVATLVHDRAWLATANKVTDVKSY